MIIDGVTVSNLDVVHFRLLEDPGLWDALISLSTEWETATTMTITDPRIVFNGLAIRLYKGMALFISNLYSENKEFF